MNFENRNSLDVSQGGKYMDITFATWMAYNVLTMFLNVVVAWVYLMLAFFGVPDWLRFWKKSDGKSQKETSEEKKLKESSVKKLLQHEYESLGPMNFHERAIAFLFFLVVMLWFFRDPRFVEGWGDLLPLGKEIGDSTAGMTIVFILFIVPKDPSFLFGRESKAQGTLLDWKYVQTHLPWSVILLMGGGFGVSDAAAKSGLSLWIGEQLNAFSFMPNEAILIIVVILTATVTEVASNTACASPNAIVYASAGDDMKILHMVKAGAFLNLSCTVVLFLMHITYGNLLFDFGNYAYANSTTTVEGLLVA